jgi:thymidylate kinase
VEGGTAPRHGARSFARRFRPLWALTLSYEKRRKLRRASQARNRGIIVVSDRYPQNQVMGFNDGPLLRHWLNHRSWFLRALARWEGAPYRWAEEFPPDLVIKLNISPDVACLRKPEMEPAESRRRVETIRGLAFPMSDIVEIDADAPLEEVLLKVKRAIWASI